MKALLPYIGMALCAFIALALLWRILPNHLPYESVENSARAMRMGDLWGLLIGALASGVFAFLARRWLV